MTDRILWNVTPTRLTTFLCFVAHLMLQAAAVPHSHDAVGDSPAHEHRSRPHIHLGGHGHHHEDGHHVHHAVRHGHHAHHEAAPIADVARMGDIAAPVSCCCHDDDAIGVSTDTLLAIPERRTGGLDSGHPVPWSPPVFMASVLRSLAPDRHGGGSLRPPDDRTRTVHDLLPHVLRI
jgi:hypothetical protein